MLNNIGKSRHPCFVPDLRRNAFSFSPLRIMFAVGLSYMGFNAARPFPSEPQFHCQELEGVAVRSFPVLPFYEVNC